MKDVGLVVACNIIVPKSFLWCTLGGKLLLELFEHGRSKLAAIRVIHGNVTTLSQVEQFEHAGIKVN